MYILAIKLDNFADDWDPYNYADAFNDRVNGIENFMTGLKEYPDQIINWLKDIVDECKEYVVIEDSSLDSHILHIPEIRAFSCYALLIVEYSPYDVRLDVSFVYRC